MQIWNNHSFFLNLTFSFSSLLLLPLPPSLSFIHAYVCIYYLQSENVYIWHTQHQPISGYYHNAMNFEQTIRILNLYNGPLSWCCWCGRKNRKKVIRWKWAVIQNEFISSAKPTESLIINSFLMYNFHFVHRTNCKYRIQ